MKGTQRRDGFFYIFLINSDIRKILQGIFLFSALQCIDIRSINFRLFDALCLVYSRQSEYFSSLGVYFIKLSTTNYCTHTSINITPPLPLKVVMGRIIVFVGFIYRIRWGPLWVGINYYIDRLLVYCL